MQSNKFWPGFALEPQTEYRINAVSRTLSEFQHPSAPCELVIQLTASTFS